jgi:hypothetical protein
MPVTEAATGWTQGKFKNLADFPRLRGSEAGSYIFPGWRADGSFAAGAIMPSGTGAGPAVLSVGIIALLIFDMASFGTVIR